LEGRRIQGREGDKRLVLIVSFTFSEIFF
jgi:hypothetical protein